MLLANQRHQHNELVVLAVVIAILLVVVTSRWIVNTHAVFKHGVDALYTITACDKAEACDFELDEICDSGRHYRIIRLTSNSWGVLVTDPSDKYVITSFITRRRSYVRNVIEKCHGGDK